MCYLLLLLIQTAELLPQGLQAVSNGESALKGTRPTFSSPFILVTEGRKEWEGVFLSSGWKGNTLSNYYISLVFYYSRILQPYFYCLWGKLEMVTLIRSVWRGKNGGDKIQLVLENVEVLMRPSEECFLKAEFIKISLIQPAPSFPCHRRCLGLETLV